MTPTSDKFCANLWLFPLREKQGCSRLWLGISCWADGLVPALPPAQPNAMGRVHEGQPGEGGWVFRDTDLWRKQRACEARRFLRGREDLGYCRGGTIKIRDYRGVGGCGDAEPRRGRDTKQPPAAVDMFSPFCREKQEEEGEGNPD